VLHGEALRMAVDFWHEDVVAALLEHGQRLGPAPPELDHVRQSCVMQAARCDLLDMVRLLVDHVEFDAAQLTNVLHTLLSVGYVGLSSVRLLLDHYAGTLLSVAELKQLSDRLPSDGTGLGRDVLRPYLALKHKRGS